LPEGPAPSPPKALLPAFCSRHLFLKTTGAPALMKADICNPVKDVIFLIIIIHIPSKSEYSPHVIHAFEFKFCGLQPDIKTCSQMA
jgi:hypothetical protein